MAKLQKKSVKKVAKAKPKSVKKVSKAVKTTTKKLSKPVIKKAAKKSPKPAVKKTVKTVVKKTEPIVQVVKKIKKYKPNKKTRYTVKELVHFKNVLLDEKTTILQSAKANMMLLVDKESGDYVGDDLSYASHMAEQGTDEMEREKNYMFVQRDEKYLGYIEEALTRIDQGTYGVCIDCLEVPKNYCKTCPLIPRERLEIVPITQHCIECKNIRG